jgi:predicted Zn finger-like uncharacterized protein
MQTQCPQCHTAFRVSEEQLALADGQVRCGQCLRVFVASEHFIDASPAEDRTALVAADEITIPEIELEAGELELPEELSAYELVPDEIELAEIEMPALEALDDRVEERVATGADTTEPLVIEEPTEAAPDVSAEALPETTADIETAESDQSAESIEESLPAANTTWLGNYAANDEYHEADLTVEESLTIQETLAVEDNEASETVEEPADHLEVAAEHGSDIPETSGPDEAIPLLVENFDASQLYPELTAAPPVERPQHTGLYSLAIIALLAAFVLQCVYALRDTLAVQPALRPLMSDFCAAFDCAITLPREPKKVLLTRSEVRSHPAESGALLVKATMQNQARFRQAYPILRLQFSDLEGRSLVGRDFMPEEYLPDDVNIKAGMPINTDVNLSLELVDPGGQAVSFDFNLL